MKFIARKSVALRGEPVIPGDKSISHRSLIIASQAIGKSKITGLLEGEDVLATAQALRELGVEVERNGETWVVNGVGVGGLSEPSRIIDMGNSGTAVRLLMGLVAGHGFNTFFTGDDSLRSRPMARVTKPLTADGCELHHTRKRAIANCGRKVLLTQFRLNMSYQLPLPQVKSAIISSRAKLAGRNYSD